jgi:hypothetical protein
VSEDVSPHRLTSRPDDHHLAAVRKVCSSSCLQPVTKSHINIQNSKPQRTPLVHCDYTYCHKHTQSEGMSALAHCGQLTNGPSFKCPSITSTVFSCMWFSILYTSVHTAVISTMTGIALPSTLKPTYFIFSNKVCKNAK